MSTYLDRQRRLHPYQSRGVGEKSRASSPSWRRYQRPVDRTAATHGVFRDGSLLPHSKRHTSPITLGADRRRPFLQLGSYHRASWHCLGAQSPRRPVYREVSDIETFFGHLLAYIIETCGLAWLMCLTPTSPSDPISFKGHVRHFL